MASSPAFAATPKCAVVQATTANTGRDGTGTIATLWSAGASGSRIDRVQIKAIATTTAGMIRFFIHDGSSARLIAEVPVSVVTVATTSPSFEEEIVFDGGLLIQTGYSLRVSTEKTETFNIIAFGGDF